MIPYKKEERKTPEGQSKKLLFMQDDCYQILNFHRLKPKTAKINNTIPTNKSTWPKLSV